MTLRLTPNLCRLLLAVLPLSSACALTLESPRELQVFQRHSAAQGSVRIAGTSEGGEFRFRINAGPWQTLPVDAASHKFEAKVEVPAGGWFRFEGEDGTGATSAVEKFGVGEVFIVAGQSNSANHGSEPQKPESGRVSSFDGKGWRLSDDPQPGASGKGGSFMPSFGDALVKRFDVPVGLIAVGVGSTSVREWLPTGIRFKQNTSTGAGVKAVGGEFESNGYNFGKLTKPMKDLGLGGFRAVLWHQGESDAGQARSGKPADRQISGDQYLEFMEQLIRRSRNVAAWPVPWFTAQVTYHGENDPADEEFRTAQKRVWDKGLAWPGPDTDALRAEYRSGVHFNPKGLRKHGELWAEKVGDWVAAMTAAPKDGPPSPDYQLVWQDEFDGPKLDGTKWAHRYVGQRRSAWIDPECVTFDGQGHMLISVKQVGDQFHGGMIGTEPKKKWTYGYFECRVQVATEPGMNTAFWLQAPRMSAPDNGKGIADDTATNGTEIDILEYIARQGDVAHHNLHWNGYATLHKSLPADTWQHHLRKDFHVYAVEWTPAGYTFYVDGHPSVRMAEAISHTDEYLILDLEVSEWAGGIKTATLPASAVFDWVRVWQKPAK